MMKIKFEDKVNDNLVEKYQKELEELYKSFNEKSFNKTNLVDRSHYCKNGNVSHCYICGNCGDTLVEPTDKLEKVVFFDWITCPVCFYKNSTWDKIYQCTYEGKEGYLNFIKVPTEEDGYILVPDIKGN